MSLSLGRPVLPATGGASTVRLRVAHAVTCWLRAHADVSVRRAKTGCRNGLLATVARVGPSDSTTPTRFLIIAWAQGADGTTVHRVIALRERGLAALQVTTPSVSNLRVGSAFSGQLGATGGRGPYQWSVVSGSLPTGLTLSSSGGVAGTPASAGTFSATVAVTDSSVPVPLRVSATVTFTVAPPPLVLQAVSLPRAVAGQYYFQTLGVTGGTAPYGWTVTSGALPVGMFLGTTGQLYGTPATTGTYAAVATVTDSSSPPQSASETLVIVVAPPPLSITTPYTMPAAAVGTPYSASLTATGGTAPYAWSVIGGLLPPGLTLSVGGLITGTATTAGSYQVTVAVVDSSAPQQTAFANLSITVTAPSFYIATAPTLQPAVVGFPYSVTFVARGGTSPYTWQKISGTLPSGLSLATNGTLSGTPAAGTASSTPYSFVVQVTDSASPAHVAQVTVSLMVVSAT